ncbi:EamA family transporter [Thermanaerosceptrum fracticalcis]|uniref:EamA family transporter n=1 Tax=Thermanaerosceptrum fracticalcis TaxID=1712410 RepID=A0A7G6E5J2_THEFR|nr:EamA family transporter [Thermanaerosceptrum fracticalcis]QNB47346.1 EamA family transporter [Thermanaerosceptrum fracticalcis]
MKNVTLMLISVFLGALGQVILKIGANKLGNLSLSLPTLSHDVIRVAKIPEIVLGFFFFGLSSLLWIKVLTKAELSYAYPMVSLGYIIVALISYFLFNERFTFSKIIGMAMVITGVIVLNK